MSSARDHHAKAEQLLEQARTTPDPVNRSQILAESQVHAILALSAGPGTIPPGPDVRRQPETSSIASTTEDLTGSTTEDRTRSAWAISAVRGLGFPVPALPDAPPDYTAPRAPAGEAQPVHPPGCARIPGTAQHAPARRGARPAPEASAGRPTLGTGSQRPRSTGTRAADAAPTRGEPDSEPSVTPF